MLDRWRNALATQPLTPALRRGRHLETHSVARSSMALHQGHRQNGYARDQGGWRMARRPPDAQVRRRVASDQERQAAWISKDGGATRFQRSAARAYAARRHGAQYPGRRMKLLDRLRHYDLVNFVQKHKLCWTWVLGGDDLQGQPRRVAALSTSGRQRMARWSPRVIGRAS
jgi:hypothetical protein